MQHVRLDNRIIAILGLLVTIVASALIADWQTIPYDPCTELSPFHHPERENHTILMQRSVLSVPQADVNCRKVDMKRTTASVLDSITINVQIQLQVSSFETHLTETVTSHCQRVHTCPEYTENSNRPLRLEYTVLWGSCLIPTMRSSEQKHHVKVSNDDQQEDKSAHNSAIKVSFCTTIIQTCQCTTVITTV